MTEKQKELPRKMMDNRNEFDSLAEAEVFAYGFGLGAMTMVSILAEKLKRKISVAVSKEKDYAAEIFYNGVNNLIDLKAGKSENKVELDYVNNKMVKWVCS